MVLVHEYETYVGHDSIRWIVDRVNSWSEYNNDNNNNIRYHNAYETYVERDPIGWIVNWNAIIIIIHFTQTVWTEREWEGAVVLLSIVWFPYGNTLLMAPDKQYW